MCLRSDNAYSITDIEYNSSNPDSFLGKGAFAEVFLAQDSVSKKQFALKIVD